MQRRQSGKHGIFSNFIHCVTNSQHLLIIFGIEKPHSTLNWYDKIVHKLAYNQLCGFHNNSSDVTNEQWISGLISNNVWQQRQGNKRVAKRSWACPCQGRKTPLQTLVITFDTTHCSDRNTICFEGLTFLLIKAASTVEWRVLDDCYGNRFSW